MGILDTFFKKKPQFDSPVLYKEKQSSPELPKLQALLKKEIPASVKEQVTQDIQHIKTGEYGEKQVRYTLENSYMPMYILHDVYLKKEKLTVQIDFLVITRKLIFIIECKNYSSNIRIDKSGQFIITKKDGTKQSISDPTDQNRRHADFIQHISPELKKRCVPVVVFTDKNQILNTEQAPETIKKQVIKLDKLVNFIRSLHDTCRLSDFSDKEMKKYADFFLEQHQENSVDYTAKYQKYLKSSPAPAKKEKPRAEPEKKILCPNCRKEVKKGKYGFYCTGKCDMNFYYLYGNKLSDAQVLSLLNKKAVTCRTKAGNTQVLPESEKNTYQGKTSHQWKSKLL